MKLPPDENPIGTRVLSRYKQLSARRDAWKNIYTLLAKYILMRPAVFGDTNSNFGGPKLSVADVADDEAVDMARTSATALGGALWPNTKESFELVPTRDVSESDISFMYESQEVKSWCEEATNRVRDAIDSPESGFQVALAEYLDGQVVFGTSGIFGEELEDDVHPLRFRSVGIETCVIDEGPDGRINTVYFEFNYTIKQVVEMYGKENVSEGIRDKFDENVFDEPVQVIVALEPRAKGKVGAIKKEKPYGLTHVEARGGHVLLEDGSDDMSAFMTRFRKLPTELMGRSLAMDALPSIKELNVLRHSYSMCLGKLLDPPLGFYHDMIGGSGVVNLSMGARVPMYATGKLPQAPSPVVNLLQGLQEPQAAVQRIESLTMRMASKFLVDKLLDFNNKTRMTKGEAEMRADYRNQALGNVFSRQIIEMFHPLVKWAFKTLLRRKLLGLHPERDKAEIDIMRALGMQPLVLPEVVAAMLDAGRMPFTIKFISPAARAMQAEALQGLTQLTNYGLAWSTGGKPEVLDNLDADAAFREYGALCGAPTRVLLGKDKVAQLRKGRMQAQAQHANMMAQEQQSATMKNVSKAAKDFAQAGVSPMAALGGMSA